MLGIADQIRALNESQLQNGKRRVEALFSQYRQRLGITIGLVIGLGLVLAAFSIRKILGLENASAASQEALQQLSARLVEAQEEERRSISRELHDEVGQSLTGVLLEMANLSKLIRVATIRTRSRPRPPRSSARSRTPSAWSATWRCCCGLRCSTISAWCRRSNGRRAKFPNAAASG